MNVWVLAHGGAVDSGTETGYTCPHKPTSQLTWGPQFSPTDTEIYLMNIRYRRYVTATETNTLHNYVFYLENFDLNSETTY
jgi:hypothetical protein